MQCPCYWYVQCLQQEFCAGWGEIQTDELAYTTVDQMLMFTPSSVLFGHFTNFFILLEWFEPEFQAMPLLTTVIQYKF